MVIEINSKLKYLENIYIMLLVCENPGELHKITKLKFTLQENF